MMLPVMPEWYLVIVVLAGLSLLGLSWWPLLGALPLLLLAIAAPIAQAAIAAAQAQFPSSSASTGGLVKRRLLTFCMHLMQPMARLLGRIRHGLTPWRRRGAATDSPRDPKAPDSVWSETWRAPEQWVALLEAALREDGAIVRHGGDYDDWDLEVRGGLFGRIDVAVAVEEHGAGKQMVRFKVFGSTPVLARVTTIVLAVLAVGSAVHTGPVAAACLAILAAILAMRSHRDRVAARRAWNAAVARCSAPTAP
jgi:hypothetical protein